jgi:deoxycytidine triphosphate deaminase
MGSIFTRSSLWRSGVGIAAGVVDAGYEGAMGALMEVNSPHEVVLHQEAKLAQVVFEELGRRSRDIVASTSPQQAVLDAMGQSKRKISHATTEPDPSDCQA